MRIYSKFFGQRAQCNVYLFYVFVLNGIFLNLFLTYYDLSAIRNSGIIKLNRMHSVSHYFLETRRICSEKKNTSSFKNAYF